MSNKQASVAVTIDSQFDAGNIRCVNGENPQDIELQIELDNSSEFFQWFYFRATAARGTRCDFRISNAGASAYPRGWENYQVVYSEDRHNWKRIADTRYQNGELQFSAELQSGVSWFAYFAPFSLQQHDQLIADVCRSPRSSLEVLGHTCDGRSIDMLRIGDQQQPIKLWAIARQHPGESMAEWWMQGFLQRLVTPDDAVSRALLSRAVIYAVPNMNPDGSYRGHLRTNAVGVNLNREWQEPSESLSPEVFFVRNKMHETGVSCCVDVHGDEALPYNFIAGTQGVRNWTPERQQLLDDFKQRLAELNPDFQTVQGYPVPSPNSANYAICSSYVADAFNCLAVTLEMPFKDTVDTPDNIVGWSDQRSAKLGESFVDVLWQLIDRF